MQYLLSMERHPGTSEVHGFHLGSIERIARQIIEEKMQTCRENDWPMVTMAIIFNGRIVDVLHRDGKWQSELWEDADDRG